MLLNINSELIKAKSYLHVALLFLSGLQMTDVELDERVTALEENGGGSNGNGNKLNEYILLVPSTFSTKAMYIS